MPKPSPLRKCWTPDMNKDDHYLVVIDDDWRLNSDNLFFNYLFNNIHSYTYESSGGFINRHLFWKNIRSFIEFKHREIMRRNPDDMRIRLLSCNIYQDACYQEMMFEKLICG